MTPADLIAHARGLANSIAGYPVNQCLLDLADALAEQTTARTALRLAVIRIAAKEGANEIELREMLSAALIADAHPSERASIALELRVAELSTALRDCLSTFRDDDKTTVITGDRQEMWRHVLETYGEPAP